MSRKYLLLALLVVSVPLSGCTPGNRQEPTAEATPRFKEVMGVQTEGFRMQTERHENDEFMTYHVSVPVTSKLIENLRMPDLDAANLALLRDLSEIPGVKEATLRPYEVVIRRARVYEWSEITPPVASLLRFRLVAPQSAQK